jgi:hypothetical protein
VNSTEEMNRRLEEDLTSIKRKHQEESECYTRTNTINENQSQSSEKAHANSTKPIKNKIRTPNLMRMQGRTELLLHRTMYRSEDQFNNFKFSPPKNKALIKFSQHTPRSYSELVHPGARTERMRREPDCFQLAETLLRTRFDNSIFRCLVDYSKTRRRAPKQPQSLTSIDPHNSVQATRVNRSPGIS